MKLELPEIQIEKSGSFKTQQFAFGDERVIMEILRSKMYSNPIKTICQEIASNARDAHREAGHNEPIVVKVPTTYDNSFYIKDYGIGITPDRMANVFIKYGNSTKRTDNTQTGGFGLGAKSPFAYTDTFSIVTITKEENGNIKREYVAFIDETGIGSMSLLKEEGTNERTGTTIIITPRSGDEFKFKNYIYEVCKYWTVKPQIISDYEPEWPAYEVQFSGNGWAILKGTGEPIALIDEIPYSMDNLPQGESELEQIKSIKKLPVLIYAKTGELRPTAQRDNIDFQPESIKFIYDKFKDIVENLNSIIEAKLNAIDNVWEARLFFNKNFNNWPISPVWKGTQLSSKYTICKDVISVAYRIYTNYSGRMSKHEIGIEYRDLEVQINSTTKIIELDQLNPPSNSFLGKIIKHIGCDELILIKFNNGEKPLDFIFPTLSAVKESMPKPPPPVRQNGTNIPKLVWASSIPKIQWASEVIDYNKTGYYVPTIHGKAFYTNVDGNIVTLDLDSLKSLKDTLGIEIACIPKVYTSKLSSSWTNAFTYAFEMADKLKSEMPKEIITVTDEIDDCISYSLLNLLKKIKPRLGKNNLIVKWMEQSVLAEDIRKEYYVKLGKLNTLIEILKLPTYDGAKFVTKSLKQYKVDYHNKYPILDMINYSDYSHNKSKYKNEITRYILSKDKQETINVISASHQNTEVIDDNIVGQQASNNSVEQPIV